MVPDRVAPLAGLAFPVRPADAAVGQEVEGAVGGGGLEDVTAEIAQGVLARTNWLEIDNPTLLPDFGGECFPAWGSCFLEALEKRERKVLGQGSFGRRNWWRLGIQERWSRLRPPPGTR